MKKEVKKALFISIFFVAVFLVLVANVKADLPNISICRHSALVDVYTGRYNCVIYPSPLPDPLVCIMNLNAACMQTGGTPLGGSETSGGTNWAGRSCEILGCTFPLISYNRKCWILCLRGAQYQGSQDTTLYNHMFIKFKKKEDGPVNNCTGCYNNIPCDSGTEEYTKWCKVSGSYNNYRTSCVRVCVKCESGYVNRDNNWNNGCEPPSCDEICNASCRQRPNLPTGCYSPMMGWPHPFCEGSCKCHCRMWEGRCILSYAENCTDQGGICREIGDGAQCQTFGVHYCSGSCQNCKQVLDTMPDNHVLVITSNISAPFGPGKYCLSFGGNNKTIDCQGNWIIGGEDHIAGIFVAGVPSTYNHTIQNCNIKSFHGGVYGDGSISGGKGIYAYGVGGLKIENVEITDIKGKAIYVPPEPPEPPQQRYSSNDGENFYPDLNFQGSGRWEYYPGKGIDLQWVSGADISKANVHDNNLSYGLHLTNYSRVNNITNSTFCFNGWDDIKNETWIPGARLYYNSLTCDQGKVPAGITCEHPCKVAFCGNNIIEPPEVCDGTNLNDKTCLDFGYTGGTLRCKTDCSGYDTSQCIGGPPPECIINSINVVPSCGSDNKCSQEENVTISVSYSGQCPSIAYIQVDANSSDGTCTISYRDGKMRGMEITCEGSPCTGNWTIPLIHPECKGKTVFAWAVGLYKYSNYTNYVTGKINCTFPGFGLFEFESAGGELCTCSNCTECSQKLNNPNCQVVRLTTNITNHTGICINGSASSNNKVFDCQGHLIDGNKTHPDQAILLNSTNNITIKNCVIKEEINGIVLINVSNSTLQNNKISDSYEGIFLINSSNNIIKENNASFNFDFGIIIDSNNDTIIQNNVANSNLGSGGITISGFNNIVQNNTANSNLHGYGITIRGFNNIVQNNTADFNNQSGISLSAGNNFLNGNRMCNNINYDIINWSNNSGDNNTCDKPFNWNDAGTTGCTYTCAPIPTECNITNASIVPYCGTDGVCNATIDKIQLNITVENPDKCKNIKKIEINASSQEWPPVGTGMVIGSGTICEISMINTTSDFIQPVGKSYVRNWTIPATIPQECQGKTVIARVAALYNGTQGNILIARKLGNFSSFKFAGVPPVGECSCERYPCCYSNTQQCILEGGIGRIRNCPTSAPMCNWNTSLCYTPVDPNVCHSNSSSEELCEQQANWGSCFWDSPIARWNIIPSVDCKHCQGGIAQGQSYGAMASCSDYKNPLPCETDSCGLGPSATQCTGVNPIGTDCHCAWNSTTSECELKFDQQGSPGSNECCVISSTSGTCEEGCEGKTNHRQINYTCTGEACEGYITCNCENQGYTAPDYKESICVPCGLQFQLMPFFEWWNVLAVVALLIIIYALMLRLGKKK